MSRYLYKKIQNISPESLNFQHSGLKLTTLGSYWPEVVKKEQGGKPRNGSLPPSSYFATSSESSRSTFDTSPHSFS